MATSSGRDEAWVTLATNDSYAVGALVLAHSLRKVNTTKSLAIMVTNEVTQGMRENLIGIFDHIEHVNVLDSQDDINLALLMRPELGITFTKLHCWRLTNFKKCVFLDADTLVLQNCDELFERAEFSAAPDIGWPDCFNTGVFVFVPNLVTYKELLKYAVEKGSFDGGDQGLLNQYFGGWAVNDIAFHLPFIYNMTASAAYSYSPAFKQYGKEVKIVHFIGTPKPWHCCMDDPSKSSKPSEPCSSDHLAYWWEIFWKCVQRQLHPSFTGTAGRLATASNYSGTPASCETLDAPRQENWELGRIDYMGSDSFANIQAKLDELIIHPSTSSGSE